MGFLGGWFRNLLIIAAVCIGMLIFVSIFYPETLSFFGLVGQAGFQLAGALKLWPLLILALLAYALPGRRRR